MAREDELRRLINAGIASDEERSEYAKIVGSGAPSAPQTQSGSAATATPPRPASSQTAAPSRRDATSYEGEISGINSEAFARGWGGDSMPPSKPGLYDAVCDGYFTPESRPDQLWFRFRAAVSSPEPFHGILVTSKGEGAGKIRAILDALGVAYSAGSGKIVVRESVKDKPAKTDWRFVTVNGKTEMRIQELYSMANAPQEVIGA